MILQRKNTYLHHVKRDYIRDIGQEFRMILKKAYLNKYIIWGGKKCYDLNAAGGFAKQEKKIRLLLFIFTGQNRGILIKVREES